MATIPPRRARQRRVFEVDAYNSLVDNQGRPSYPIQLQQEIVTAPGQYRDIFHAWRGSDGADDCFVFTKQLAAWSLFRHFQSIVRGQVPGATMLCLCWTPGLNGYVDELANFSRKQLQDLVPASFITLSNFVVSENLDTQNKVTTWLEYIFFLYTRQEKRLEVFSLDRCSDQESVDRVKAFRQLRARLHQVIIQHRPKGYTDERSIWFPTELEGKRRDLYRNQLCKLLADGEQGATQSVQEELDRLDKFDGYMEKQDRSLSISSYRWGVRGYYQEADRVEIESIRLRWAVDQLALVVEEETGVAPSGHKPTLGHVKGYSELRLPPVDFPELIRPVNPIGDFPSIRVERSNCAAGGAFAPFLNFPQEIQDSIWQHALPDGPTTHFFDVVTHTPTTYGPSHYRWNCHEFRVVPNQDHDSGYRTVHNLLAACRNSRKQVCRYYRTLQRRTGFRSDNQYGVDDNEATDTHFPTVRSFDWIPAEDVIVLCFPPKHADTLPDRNAISLARRAGGGCPRNVGLMFPKEMMMLMADVESRDANNTWNLETEEYQDYGKIGEAANVARTTTVLNLLRNPRFVPNLALRRTEPKRFPVGFGAGIKKVFFIVEGWTTSMGAAGDDAHAKTDVQKQQFLGECSKNHVGWIFEHSASREPMRPWDSALAVGQMENRRPGWTQDSPFERQVFFLGTGRRAFMTQEVGDIVEHEYSYALGKWALALHNICQDEEWGWDEFGGVEILGLVDPDFLERGNKMVL
ncbi:hypothetical protein QBC44DRAFT_333815 [Cladorrhinum sp. PSN332]|nr:hypothetical protein QBC44DRAFT_333815 [Cladorrhinum sp. PSN332]